jgi:hypothetical protein
VNGEFETEKEKARELKAAAERAAPLTEENKAPFETVRFHHPIGYIAL